MFLPSHWLPGFGAQGRLRISVDVVGSGWPKGKRVSVRVTRRWAILVDFRSLDETYHAVGTQVRRFGMGP